MKFDFRPSKSKLILLSKQMPFVDSMSSYIVAHASRTMHRECVDFVNINAMHKPLTINLGLLSSSHYAKCKYERCILKFNIWRTYCSGGAKIHECLKFLLVVLHCMIDCACPENGNRKKRNELMLWLTFVYTNRIVRMKFCSFVTSC